MLSIALTWVEASGDLPPGSNSAKGLKLPKRHDDEDTEKRRLQPEEATAPHSHVEANLSDATMLPAILLLLGLRPAEGAGLQWGDIGPDTCAVRRAVLWLTTGPELGRTKTKGSRRTLRLSGTAQRMLVKYRQWYARTMNEAPEGEALLFPSERATGPINYSTVYTRWIGLRTALKLEGITLYSMRHAHASLLARDSTDAATIAKRLGHSSTALVHKTYVKPFEDAEDRCAESFDRMIARHDSDRPPHGPRLVNEVSRSA